MRVYVPDLPEDGLYEWALAAEPEGWDQIQMIHTFEPVASEWTPVEVEILREDDEGHERQEADVPWLGGYLLAMRPAAVEVIAPLVKGQAELLALACPDAELWLLHVTECRDALDESRSELVRYPSSGRIMDIERHVFDPAALVGARCFKIPQKPGRTFLTGDVVDTIAAAGLRGFGAKLVWESNPDLKTLT